MNIAGLLLLLCIASCHCADSDEAESLRSQLDRVALASKAARSVLRVKRGWGSIRRKLNPFERNDERREAAKRERNREAGERAREHQVYLDRVCPASCWAGWEPAEFGPCTQPCGGAGVQSRSRRVKTAAELGECATWVQQRGCAGESVQTQSCNRKCDNGGTPVPTGCDCPAGWSGLCCSTRITCPDPGKPVNGVSSPSGSGLHFGTVVHFTCNTGYTLQGPASRTCTGSGTWTDSVPTCNIVSCPDPGTPANSQREFVSGSSFVFDSSVRVTCNHGYSITGDAVRKCEASGQWSGTPPSCQQIICPVEAAPANGRVEYPRGRTLDTEAKYSCNTGYVLQGTAVRKCQSNGQWTTQAPSCQRIECSNLAAPAHGTVSHAGSTGGKTAYGQTATFACDSGYDLLGASQLTCAGTSPQGSWSAAPPTCQPVNCGDPGSPQNGVKSGSVFTLGGSVSFTCTPGYLLDGTNSATCQADRKWSSPKPLCQACAADFYKEGTNAATTCTACPAHSTTSGARAASTKTACVCTAGYRGSPGGPCTQITCQAPATPANSIRKSCDSTYSGQCVFECVAGHVVSKGDTMRTCGESGSWSGQELVCTACPVNTYKSSVSQCTACPNNTATSGSGNEKSGCVCKTGWTGPSGGPCTDVDECSTHNGGCAQTCINEPGSFRCECTDAGWIPDAEDPKKCNPKNQCSAMQRPANGGLVCHSQVKTNTERCQIKCNKGFDHLESPNAFEECGPSTNWQWNHEIQGKPILDCVSSFFEEVELEIDVFYFVDHCSSLTASQKREVKQEFASFLTSRGICLITAEEVCKIEDVTISCGEANRRKRATFSEEMKITFKLRSVAKSQSGMEDCGATCKTETMESARQNLLQQSEKVKSTLGAGTPRPRPGPPGPGATTQTPQPSLTLAGISFLTSTVNVGELEVSCAIGMVSRNASCVACPSGSYKVLSRDECNLCPIGSYQSRDGQTLCLPCAAATIKGSKTCH